MYLKKEQAFNLPKETECFSFVSGTARDPYPISQLFSGEFNNQFPGRLDLYPNITHAARHSLAYETGPKTVYLLLLGYSEEDVLLAARAGRFNETILGAIPRDQLRSAKIIENPEFKKDVNWMDEAGIEESSDFRP